MILMFENKDMILKKDNYMNDFEYIGDVRLLTPNAKSLLNVETFQSLVR